MRPCLALAVLLFLTATSARGVVFEEPVVFPPSDFRLAAAGSTAVIVSTSSPAGSMHFARSADFGRTWSPSVPLRAPEVLASFPAVAGDGAGNWLVAWIEGGVRVSQSSDDGVSWQEPVDVGLMATEVAVAPAAPGIWLVAAISRVESTEGVDVLVLVSRSVDGGRTWGSPLELVRAHNPTTSYPRPVFRGPAGLALAASDGTAVLAWANKYSSGRLGGFDPVTAFRSTDAGRWWTPLSLPPLDGLDPTVATNGDGGWAMATNFWLPTDSPPDIPHEIRSAYSTDDGDTWRAAVTIFEEHVGISVLGAVLAAVGADTWVVLWDGYGVTGFGVAHRCGASPSW